MKYIYIYIATLKVPVGFKLLFEYTENYMFLKFIENKRKLCIKMMKVVKPD